MTKLKVTAAQITIRPSTKDDLDRLFEIQLDQQGNHMVAFASRAADDRQGFNENWLKGEGSDRRHEVILVDGVVAGSIGRFMLLNQQSIGYWIDRPYWGRGVASEALRQFLDTESIRPLYARVAFDNQGSIRVLQKNGFIEIGRDRCFARARNQEIEEIILQLN